MKKSMRSEQVESTLGGPAVLKHYLCGLNIYYSCMLTACRSIVSAWNDTESDENQHHSSNKSTSVYIGGDTIEFRDKLNIWLFETNFAN